MTVTVHSEQIKNFLKNAEFLQQEIERILEHKERGEADYIISYSGRWYKFGIDELLAIAKRGLYCIYLDVRKEGLIDEFNRKREDGRQHSLPPSDEGIFRYQLENLNDMIGHMYS